MTRAANLLHVVLLSAGVYTVAAFDVAPALPSVGVRWRRSTVVSMSRHEPIGGDRRLALQKLAAVGLVLWPGAALAAPLDRPLDLGVMGARKEGQQGFLNKCPEGTMRPCISSYDEAAGTYVPPLSFNPFDENGRYKKSAKTLTTSADAVEQLKAAVSACGGTIVKSNERYVYAEFADGDKVDDVEFLFSRTPIDAALLEANEGNVGNLSLSLSIVNFRSASRNKGKDDKKHRERFRDVRKKLQEPEGSQWVNIGRSLS